MAGCSESPISGVGDVYFVTADRHRIRRWPRVGDRARAAATQFDDCLHLAVSMRSFRAENVSAFVKALLDCEKEQAKKAFAELAARYPIAITRDLNAAKQWIRTRARGTERYGLVASSKAMRLKPHAIDIRVSVDPVHYFLNEQRRHAIELLSRRRRDRISGAGTGTRLGMRELGRRFSFQWLRTGAITISAANAGATSQTPTTATICATLTASCSRARDKAWLFLFRQVTQAIRRAPEFYDSTFNYLQELGISCRISVSLQCAKLTCKMGLMGSAT